MRCVSECVCERERERVRKERDGGREEGMERVGGREGRAAEGKFISFQTPPRRGEGLGHPIVISSGK